MQMEQPNSENPISIRRRLAEQVAETNPAATGWAIQAATDIVRARLLPAESRIIAELPVEVSESEGRLSYKAIKHSTSARRGLKRVARWGLEGVQALNGNPFSNIDAIGNPYHDDSQSTFVSTNEKSSRVGDKIRHVRDVKGYLRDAMRAVYKPDQTPHKPGWIEFFASFPPLTSQIEDLNGLMDLPSLLGTIPVLNQLPGFRRAVPRPNAVKNDLIVAATDLIPFSGAATQTVGRIFLPFPGSVSMLRHGNYIDNRVIEQYFPQSVRRELAHANPTAITERQGTFIEAIHSIVSDHPDEVIKLQKAIGAILKKAGLPQETWKPDFKNVHGSLTLTNTETARVDLTETQVESLIYAVRTGVLSAKELNNAIAGLDLMDAIKQAMTLEPQITSHRVSQAYRRP